MYFYTYCKYCSMCLPVIQALFIHEDLFCKRGLRTYYMYNETIQSHKAVITHRDTKQTFTNIIQISEL